MFYQVIRFLARLSFLLYCRRRLLYCDSMINLKGPAIIASSHHNSMLDAALVGTFCNRPIHYIVRSDMFNKKILGYLLRKMNGIPVYRQSEEKEKMRENRSSIEMCKNVLKQNGIILIFSEGLTEHNWQLKPVKSGTARIVKSCMDDEYLRQNLQVLPTGITYSNYDRIGKTLLMVSKQPIMPGQLDNHLPEGEWRKKFNQQLEAGMLAVAPQMHNSSRNAMQSWKLALLNCYKLADLRKENAITRMTAIANKIQNAGPSPASAISNTKYLHYPLSTSGLALNILLTILLFLPALAGVMLNALYYYPIRSFSFNKTKNSIFFDSVFFGLLTYLYPVYLVVIGLILGFFTSIPFWAWWIIMPFSGWSAVEWWSHCMAVRNYFSWPRTDKNMVHAIMDTSS